MSNTQLPKLNLSEYTAAILRFLGCRTSIYIGANLSRSDEAGFESLVGSDETIVPARIYKEKALCMAKGFISYALSNDIATFDSILSWLYIDKNGPSILKDVVAHAKELMSRRQIAQGAHAPGQEPLSIGAEMLLKRYLPSLEGKLAEVNIVP